MNLTTEYLFKKTHIFLSYSGKMATGASGGVDTEDRCIVSIYLGGKGSFLRVPIPTVR